MIDREDVFVIGTNGAMYWKTYKTESGWTTGWTYLGGNLPGQLPNSGVKLASSPTVSLLGYAYEVWAGGTDGYIYLKEYSIGGGTAPQSGTWWPSTTTWSAGMHGPPPGS
jgi:hypothetical protein